MPEWIDLALDAQQAASVLLASGRHRSAASRAYYAVYARVAHHLIANGVAMPSGREGPSHAKLKRLVVANLYHLDPPSRKVLSKLVSRLYTLRLAADYEPSTRVGLNEGREAHGIMRKCFQLL